MCSQSDCLYSPGLGPNPGVILFCPDGGLGESVESIMKLPYATKDFQEWKDALNLKVGCAVGSYMILLYNHYVDVYILIRSSLKFAK